MSRESATPWGVVRSFFETYALTVLRRQVVKPCKSHKPIIIPNTILLVAARAVSVSSSTTLGELLLGNGDDVDGDRLEAKVLEEVLGLAIDVELAALGVLGEVQSGDLRNVLILTLTLLLLKLEGDTTDGSTLNSLHQVGGVAGNLVAQALGGDNSDLITDTLVGLEVQGELGVVSLNDDLGGLLDGLGTNATHFGGIGLLDVGR
jgi:hypothetical protein